MPDFTARITKILRENRITIDTEQEMWAVGQMWFRYRSDAEAHVAALVAEAAEQHYRPRIKNAEQLMALPSTTVIKTEGGSIACRFHDGIHGVVFGDDRPFKWSCLESELPGFLLWSPGAGE